MNMSLKLPSVRLNRDSVLALTDEELENALDALVVKKLHTVLMERRTQIFRMVESVPGAHINIPVMTPISVVGSTGPLVIGDTYLPKVVSVEKTELFAILAAFL